MRTISKFLAATFLLGCGAAQAQSEYGSRIEANTGAVGEIRDNERDTALRVMNIFGRCVARNRHRFAEEVLAMPLYSRRQYERINSALGGVDGCLGAGERTLSFSSMLLVGAMAEWFIVDRYARRDLGAVARLTDERLVALGLAPRSGNEGLAICVARADPASVRALTLTQPASPEEREAVARIVPHVASCLPQGETFNLNYPSLRAIVASGLYRLLSILDSSPA